MNRLHTRVSKILDKTMTLEDILDGFSNRSGEKKYIVIPELHEYVKELLAYSPGLKFAHKHDNELWVYLEDNPYVLGYIGWADYQEWVSGEKKYMVASRNICNEKYASYNDQHSMHTSINLKTILSKAKKAMRPINPIEIAEMEVRSIEDKFKKGINNKRNIADNLWSKIRYCDDVLQREFRNILKSDYKFVQPELKHQLQECFKAIDVSKEANAKTLHVHFVRAYDKYGDGELHFEVIDVNNLQTNTPQVVKEIKRYTEAEMPEDILGKVSVLNITDVDEYVEDVGYNTGDGMFYVVK
tara:strand:- start:687 stop:1583 length:897 start_codon:yes stop_codon:yes gene_type:complete